MLDQRVHRFTELCQIYNQTIDEELQRMDHDFARPLRIGGLFQFALDVSSSSWKTLQRSRYLSGTVLARRSRYSRRLGLNSDSQKPHQRLQSQLPSWSHPAHAPWKEQSTSTDYRNQLFARWQVMSYTAAFLRSCSYTSNQSQTSTPHWDSVSHKRQT